jgi:copper homeostasis protein
MVFGCGCAAARIDRMTTTSPQSGILEVIACSEADAVAAADGGADRLEVISHYEYGGLTPPLELVRRIAERVRVPLRVMVRQTEWFVVGNRGEIEELCAEARAFSEIGVDGIVIGFLQNGPGGDCRIDHRMLERVLGCAPNIKATFHRAFEELTDPSSAIAELKRQPQIDRILTSGGSDSWAGKLDRLAAWQRVATPEIELVIGGGTDEETIRLLKPAGIREFHIGRAVRAGMRTDGPILIERVRALAKLVHGTISDTTDSTPQPS